MGHRANVVIKASETISPLIYVHSFDELKFESLMQCLFVEAVRNGRITNHPYLIAHWVSRMVNQFGRTDTMSNIGLMNLDINIDPYDITPDVMDKIAMNYGSQYDAGAILVDYDKLTVHTTKKVYTYDNLFAPSHVVTFNENESHEIDGIEYDANNPARLYIEKSDDVPSRIQEWFGAKYKDIQPYSEYKAVIYSEYICMHPSKPIPSLNPINNISDVIESYQT